MDSLAARLLAGVFILLLGGCAVPMQTRALLDSAARTPRSVELAGVAFFAQEDYQCGPAALAMALESAGVKVDPAELKPEVYLPEKQGSLQVEMLAAARRHGVVAYQLPPRLDIVLAEVADGTPVIVLQNLALSWYPIWHYAIVIGYNLDSAEIILRSGREERQIMPMSTFEHTWARSGYWAMETLPPEKIPPGAEELTFVAAVSALEKTGQFEGARKAYQAALKRWPGNLLAQIGAGNTAYRMHEYGKAEAAFMQAVQDHPESVAALNNLAQTLIDQGRYAEALTYARRAVALGGPLKDIARATLDDIERKLNK
jgi:tetratricopeptide (TPR) repeat protein